MEKSGHRYERCDHRSGLQAVVGRRDDPRIVECAHRLRYVRDCLAMTYEHLALTGSFNESLRAFRMALRSGTAQSRKRLHPYLELAIANQWWRLQREDPDLADRAPTAAELTSIVDELVEQLRPPRGRPAHTIVKYHVHGLMVLIRQMTGCFPQASQTSNSVYDRRMTTDGGRLIVQLVQGVDPTISESTLAGFIIKATRSGELDDKRFKDFYPLYGSSAAPETGQPVLATGMRLEAFSPVFPIYIS